MQAVWYTASGAAHDVLTHGELPDPQPGPGEVRVRLSRSGINPGDTKKRADYFGLGLAYPLVIPHSDGAGVIDAVGPGVDTARVGRRVWVHGAQSYRPFGTAAQWCAVPSAQAVDLPDSVTDEVGACLGIPGITAHRCVFADGAVTGQTVLVHGVLGAVGSLAAQLARWGGAKVIGTVRRTSDLSRLASLESPPLPAERVVALDSAAADAIAERAPAGVNRIIDVSFSDNIALAPRVLAQGGVVVAYGTRDENPSLPFWDLLFLNAVVRLCGSDDFPATAKVAAAADLTAAAREGALRIPVAEILPLERCADAHDLVDAGAGGRVLLSI